MAIMLGGSFADYVTVPAKHALPVARASAEAVACLTSGLTASIALEQSGRMGAGETVLVTAAAGGTGQFAVQLAKLAGGACSPGWPIMHACSLCCVLLPRHLFSS